MRDVPILRFLFGLVLAAFTFAGIAAGAFFISARKDVTKSASAIASVAVDTHQLREHADRVLTEAGLAAKSAREVSDAEAKEFPRTLKQTHKTLDSINALIEHTDESLNAKGQGLLDTAGNAIALDALKIQDTAEQANVAIGMFTQRTEPVLKEAADAMHETEQTMKAVREVAEDESWQHIPGSLDAITTSMLSTSGNLNAMSVDAKNALHSTLHPKWPFRVLKAVEAVPFNLVRLVF